MKAEVRDTPHHAQQKDPSRPYKENNGKVPHTDLESDAAWEC